MTSNVDIDYEVSPIITKSFSAKPNQLSVTSFPKRNKSDVTDMSNSQSSSALQPILSADELTSPIISRQQQEKGHVNWKIKVIVNAMPLADFT